MENKKTIRINIEECDVEETIEKEKQEKEIQNNRFYLPVLHLNDSSYWPSKKNSERKFWTDKIAFETCVGNCCNIKGLKAACCQVDPDDLEHVLGPVDEEDIKLIINKLNKNGLTVKRSDIVIDYEEGKILGEKFFGGHKIFQDKNSYPMLRLQINGPRFSCKFLSSQSGKCTIYSFRPKMCSTYLCQFVLSNFFVRTEQNPNTFKKLK
jgi:Fe-S-cluster containining protein